MKTSFKFYSDSQHGWLAVKVRLLADLGIANQITPFSYMKGQTAYLEEDCDLSLFMRTYKEKMGFDPTIVTKTSNTSSPIRSYQRFYNYLNEDY